MKLAHIRLLVLFLSAGVLSACGKSNDQINTDDIAASIQQSVQQSIIEENEAARLQSYETTSETTVSEPQILENDDFRYVYDNEVEGIKLLKYIGTGRDIIIPDEIDGQPVRIIGKDFAYKADGIISITVSDSVTEIQDRAFAFSFGEIETIGANVEVIGNSAFDHCKIKHDLIIPDSVKIIGESAFATMNSDYGLTLGKGIEIIKKSAFSGAFENVDEITIPGNVKEIEEQAFFYNHINKYNLEEGVEYVGSLALNLEYGGYVYLPQSLKNIHKIAITADWFRVIYNDTEYNTRDVLNPALEANGVRVFG
ncbi:MAG: leucine-rich repeat domain-containing protein [Firmicutes bacterium]|nr:leucine-rich repeat domain-containing protein [Bacillota bacterium]